MIFFTEDSLSYSNGMKFSTYDQDNDNDDKNHCATYFDTAWWMDACFWSALNGAYSPTSLVQGGTGILWERDLRNTESLKFTEMKICRR